MATLSVVAFRWMALSEENCRWGCEV